MAYLEGRPWHGCGSEYLEGTAEELGNGHV
jgi:hypothetical protein